MDLTLAIALGGVALGGASLVWQIISFRRSGSDVAVEVKTAIGVGGLASNLPLMLAIEATNRGRWNVEILAYGIDVGGGDHIVNMMQIPLNVPLPHTLLGDQAVTFYMPKGEVDAYVEGRNPRPFVRLGNGKTVRGRWFGPDDEN